MNARAVFGSVAGLLLAFTALTACDPPPPRTVFTVNTTVDGRDAVPGDGVCEVNPGVGDCTLRAAVTEANTVPAADLSIPPGTYGIVAAIGDVDGHHDIDVTGDVLVNGGDHVRFAFIAPTSPGGPAIDIHPGARLEVSGFGETGNHAPIKVAGLLLVDRGLIGTFDANPAVEITPTGSAFLSNSAVGGLGGPRGVVVNDGALLTSFTTLGGVNSVVLRTGEGATSSLSATQLERYAAWRGSVTPDPTGALCVGSAPESRGYNHTTNTSCSLTQATDVQDGDFGTSLVDRIPIGTNGCGSTYVVDVLSNPRPVDGNGDGVAACDIGGTEQPAV